VGATLSQGSWHVVRGVVDMRIAALVLGIIGGLASLAGAAFALFFGVMGALFGVRGAETVSGLGFAAIPLAVLGLVGAGLAPFRPKAAAWCMSISAVGGLIAVSAVYISVFRPLVASGRPVDGLIMIFAIYIVAALCLGIATLMAFPGSNEQKDGRLDRLGKVGETHFLAPPTQTTSEV